MKFDFTVRFTKERLREFADLLKDLQYKIGFKVSARGWCYLLEQAGHIDKSQFDKVADALNKCRKEGFLPVDFVAEEDARSFAGVERPSEYPIEETLTDMLEDVLNGHRYFTPDWWEGEKYYIQVLVEKIDLKTLFEPVCREYHIPIANAKGWSSILQRAEYARRFSEAQDRGMQCVLLYCGDHDPDGLRISDTIYSNLQDVENVNWEDGYGGFNPDDLIIDRIGLNYNFIIQNNFTWIDNLITGSGKNLADPKHPNFKLPYLQNYLSEIGERKCEANAIVTTPYKAKQFIRERIESYLGEDASNRFGEKRKLVKEKYERILSETGLKPIIEEFLNGEG